MEARAAAWDWIWGSDGAWRARTVERIVVKWSFCLKVGGLGGSLEVVPMARVGLGGDVGRRVRRWEVGVVGSSNMYWRGC